MRRAEPSEPARGFIEQALDRIAACVRTLVLWPQRFQLPDKAVKLDLERAQHRIERSIVVGADPSWCCWSR